MQPPTAASPHAVNLATGSCSFQPRPALREGPRQASPPAAYPHDIPRFYGGASRIARTQRERVALQRGARHLRSLGDRALFHFLDELAGRTGNVHAILDALNAYQRITPEQVRIVGGDQFPRPPLDLVPDIEARP